MENVVIHKVTLKKVLVEKRGTEKQYKITIRWELLQGAGSVYMGPFFLAVMALGKTTYHEITMMENSNTQGHVEKVTLDENISYTAGISINREKNFPLEFDEITITGNVYKNVMVEYDGKHIVMDFNPPSCSHLFTGEITIKPMMAPSQLHEADHNATRLRLGVEPEDYESDGKVNFSIRPTCKKISFGPPTEDFILFTGHPELKSMDKKDKGLNIECILSDNVFSRRKSSGCTLKAALWRDGKEIWLSNPHLIKGENQPTITFLATSVTPLPHCLDGCSLALYVCTGNTLNKAMTLDAPRLFFPKPRVHFKGKGATVTWEGKPWGQYSIKVGENAPVDVTGCSYDIASIPTTNCHVSVACTNGGMRGPYSDEVSLFLPGYYPLEKENKKCLHLCLESYNQEELKLNAGSNVLESYTAAIEVLPFKLEKNSDNTYLLTIKKNDDSSSKDTFNRFMEKLFEAKLTVEGYYRVRQLVARCGLFDQEQTLDFLNGLEKGKRMMDIFPGACLKIETATFQPTLSETVDDHGYIRASTESYWISLGNNEKGESVLSYNENLEQVMGGWDESTAGGGNTLPGIGGLMDLFCKSVRMPYARIYYPEAFHPSQKASTYYISDNITIAVSDDYFKFPKTIEDLQKSDLKCVILRGRSMISLSVRILVDGRQEIVPLGTRLGDLASRMGLLTAVNRLRLWRETGCCERVSPAEVIFDWAKDKPLADKIFLLPGDIIQIVNKRE